MNRNNVQIAECRSIQSGCGSFATCLNQYQLDGQKINVDATYKLGLELSDEVDALCVSVGGSGLAMNAILTIECNNDESVLPTEFPTTDPTSEPTSSTLTPTLNPTLEPTVPTLQPTPSPAYVSAPCISFSNEFCIFADIYPKSNEQTSFNVPIAYQDVIDTELKINVLFTISNNIPCTFPQLSFNYELIDYDTSTEYIDITGNLNNATFNNFDQRCNGGFGCGTFVDCFSDVLLFGVDQIRLSDVYEVDLTVSSAVDDLCSSTAPLLIINSVLTLTCSQESAAPTLEPTTYEPTIPTLEPTTVPTLEPTSVTQTPSLSPTANIQFCGNPLTGENRYCYYENIYPPTSGNYSKDIIIQQADINDFVYFDIFITSRKNECIQPTITFLYEEIDYNSFTEYIKVLDENNVQIAECRSIQSGCGSFATCLNQYQLNVQRIGVNATYKIGLELSDEVDALCVSVGGSGLAMNAILRIECNNDQSTITAIPTTPFPTSSPSSAPTTVCSDCLLDDLLDYYCINDNDEHNIAFNEEKTDNFGDDNTESFIKRLDQFENEMNTNMIYYMIGLISFNVLISIGMVVVYHKFY